MFVKYDRHRFWAVVAVGIVDRGRSGGVAPRVVGQGGPVCQTVTPTSSSSPPPTPLPTPLLSHQDRHHGQVVRLLPSLFDATGLLCVVTLFEYTPVGVETKSSALSTVLPCWRRTLCLYCCRCTPLVSSASLYSALGGDAMAGGSDVHLFLRGGGGCCRGELHCSAAIYAFFFLARAHYGPYLDRLGPSGLWEASCGLDGARTQQRGYFQRQRAGFYHYRGSQPLYHVE